MSRDSKKVSRRSMIRTGLTAAGAALASPGFSFAASGEKRPPNIVWLISDDLCPDLGCYGNDLVNTPHLDRLAAEGARYTNAFTCAAVCSPSRSAWMTGMYQTSIGCHNHRTIGKQPLPGGVQPFTQYLQGAGYVTIAVKGMGARMKTDFNFAETGVFQTSNPYKMSPHRPFFAYANFREPHRPFVKTKNGVDPGKVELPPYYPDHPDARQDWAAYLDSINLLDKNVGIFLNILKDLGVMDNTVIFFVGDNGRPHLRGKQWLYDGGIHVPLIVRWPGTIEPGTVCDDLVSSIDLTATTLAAAGVEPPEYMQGQVFVGPGAQTRDYIAAARDRCDEAFDRIRCIRDKRYKYIRNFYPEIPYWQTSRYKDKNYPMLDLMKQLHAEGKLTPAQERFFAPEKPAEELYDLSADPHEIHNLADSPEHKSTLESMRARLNQWIEETGDQGQTPEPKENWEAIMQDRREKYPDYEPDEWDKRYDGIRKKLEERDYRPKDAE